MSPKPGPDAAGDLLAAIRQIAERAGAAILTHYAEGEAIEVRAKADASPVTAADHAAEDVILEALAVLTPEIPVVSEEAAAAGHVPDVSGGTFWLVDPLDGTKEFLTRNGEFTVNIALVEQGLPVAGVVHAPARALTWAGAAGHERGGAAANGARATVAETGREGREICARAIPAEGAVVVASRRHGSGAQMDAFLADYTVADRVTAGSSLKFCLVAEGTADLYPRFGRTMEWDTAAGHAVLRAAGGTVLTDEGAPLVYGKPGFENPFFIAYGRAER
jgi:3'(2'), 5'-bisphosphate nucleotidase